MTGSSIETEVLPVDEGAEAYRQRKLLETNPYSADDWRHGEWQFGWMNEEECDGSSSFDWQSGCFKQ
jgi:hypothetical protein